MFEITRLAPSISGSKQDFVTSSLRFKSEFNEERFDTIRYITYNITNLELPLLCTGTS